MSVHSEFTRADYCVIACAEAWRDCGEVLVSPMGTVPAIAARLARATFAPEMLLSDGEAAMVPGVWSISTPPPSVMEGYLPYRAVFDLVWSGRRHVMMGPSQLDRFGNANISAIGDYERPTRQLLGVRGAPGNTVNHATSYWVPKHSPRTFVEHVDMVSGVGYDSAAKAGPAAERYLDLRRVVSNLGVFDFATPDHRMRLVSVHPGVSVEEVVAATGFDLHIESVVTTREPTEEEMRLLREVIDPKGLRDKEVAS